MMKRFYCTTILLTMVLSATVFAHPPKNAKCSFDAKKNMFTAVIPHDVGKKTEKHYIDEVELTIERERMDKETGKKKTTKQELTLEYKKQTGGDAHYINVPMVNIQPGDKIHLKANCNVFGWRNTEFTVPEPKKSESSDQKESKKQEASEE